MSRRLTRIRSLVPTCAGAKTRPPSGRSPVRNSTLWPCRKYYKTSCQDFEKSHPSCLCAVVFLGRRPSFAYVCSKAGQAIKDGVRQRVTKWKHELAPSSRSTSLSSSSLSLASSPAATVSNAATGKTGGGSGGSGGRATERTDVLPFLISLARLARQLEIDAASYTLRWVTRK